MDSDFDCVHKGSHCDATVDAERVQDLVHEHYAGVFKYRKDANKKLTMSTCLSKSAKLEAAEGCSKMRRTKMENRKVLVEMLLRSDIILQKAVRLQEEAQLLLQDISDDIHASPS